MYSKTETPEGKFRYTGETFGFNFEYVCDTDEEFTTWLASKLGTYLLSDIELTILKNLLGIKELEDRVFALEP